MKIRIPNGFLERVEAHARSDYPDECCGLMVGTIGAETADIHSMHSSRNLTSGDPMKSFEVDPRLRFDLMKAARGRNDGTDIIGHYHSHPDGPATPSATDLSMAYEPHMIWLICGLGEQQGFQIGAFRANTRTRAFDTLQLVSI